MWVTELDFKVDRFSFGQSTSLKFCAYGFSVFAPDVQMSRGILGLKRHKMGILETSADDAQRVESILVWSFGVV